MLVASDPDTASRVFRLYKGVAGSYLPARLGLKDGHSSRLFEARGLYFRWPQPMRKYINVFGR